MSRLGTKLLEGAVIEYQLSVVGHSLLIYQSSVQELVGHEEAEECMGRLVSREVVGVGELLSAISHQSGSDNAYRQSDIIITIS